MEKNKSKKLKIIIGIISCILGISLIIAGLYFWKNKESDKTLNKELKLIPSQSFEILSSKPVVEGEEHYFRSEIKNATKESIHIKKIVLTYLDENNKEMAQESYVGDNIIKSNEKFEFDVIYPALVYKKMTLKFEYYGE